MMHATGDALLAFFEHVAMRDPEQLEKLMREPSFSVQPGRWSFSLPDLHAFLVREHAEFRGVDYKAFRRMLFDSPVNQATRAHGAEITIAENRRKVDESTYALVWSNP